MSLFQRRKLVRIHFLNANPSIEGILFGRHGGHYVVHAPNLLEAEERTHSLDGHVLVPQEQVMFVQVLPG